MAMTLSEFTRTLDPKTLPKILQIQSGIYSQGAVYELFGQECCLVTGDLMKIIDIGITRFTARKSDGRNLSLPLDYPGLFRIEADSQPYLSIREITDSLKISSHRLAQPAFFTAAQLHPPEGCVNEGESFQIKSVILGPDGDGYVDCEVLHREPKLSFRLKLSQEGQFTECDDDQFYTLRELAQWRFPKGRTRMVTAAKSLPTMDTLFPGLLENVCGQMTLTPVYVLQAVMQLRKSIVLIPSNLDVEVMDVTEQYDMDAFIQPLSLLDVFQKPADFFPIVAEVLEKPVMDRHMPEELCLLLHSPQVVIHQAYEAKRVLATETRLEAPRHFLIPVSYNGRLKRRPREFPTAYDLERACSDTETLHVVATRGFESPYDGLASVHTSDEFVVKRNKHGEVRDAIGEATDTLSCQRIKGKNREPVQIPMYQDGGFMEVVHDKRQYSIVEVCHWFPLPFNVKVSVRDLSLKEDVLASLPGLRIEEELTEPYLLVSTLDLSSCWEVAVKRTHMTVRADKAWTGGPPGCGQRSAIEDISEDCYYTMRRYAVTTVTPPPRPPKKPRVPPARPARPQPVRPENSPAAPPRCSPKSPRAAVVSRESSTDRSTSPTVNKRTVPISPVTLPRLALETAIPRGTSLDEVCVTTPDDTDPHDYEYIDEEELENIRRQWQGQAMSLSAKAKPSNTVITLANHGSNLPAKPSNTVITLANHGSNLPAKPSNTVITLANHGSNLPAKPSNTI